MLCENNLSIVRQYDSAIVRQRNSTTARQYDSATVRLYERTTVRQYDSTMALTSHNMSVIQILTCLTCNYDREHFEPVICRGGGGGLYLAYPRLHNEKYSL